MKYRKIKSYIIQRFVIFSVLFFACNALFDWGLQQYLNWFEASYAPYHTAQFFSIPLEGQIAFFLGFLVYFSLLFLLYFFGIKFFAKGIQAKIQNPLSKLTEGLGQITQGNLDTRISFDAEHEFLEMKQSFNHMADELAKSKKRNQQYEQERATLFSNIAHDLKTPITTISGFSQALERDMITDPIKQKEYLQTISSKSNQIAHLLDRLLSYTKLENPQYELTLKPTDIVELLRSRCADFFAEFEKKQILFESELPDFPIVSMADSLELSRAIDNLLSNAIHHNKNGSLVCVSLALISDKIQIKIADNGDPIPPELAEQLFEPFVCGDSSRLSKNGNGLGLSIAKKVLERHNGALCLQKESAPLVKSFVLTLSFQSV